MAAYVGRSLGKDLSRAKELLNRSLQLKPNTAMALTIAAWSEALLGNPVEALEFLRRAERQVPAIREHGSCTLRNLAAHLDRQLAGGVIYGGLSFSFWAPQFAARRLRSVSAPANS